MADSSRPAPALGRRTLLRSGATLSVLAAPLAGLASACSGDPGATSRRPKSPRTSAAEPGGPAPEVLVLHHALGLTDGVRTFAQALRRAGHTIHTPDLYDGRVFTSLETGIAYANRMGLDEFRRRGIQAAQHLVAPVFYVGFSLGVLPAQELAATSPGARGAVLLEACLPVDGFGTRPADVAVQVHGMDADPSFAGEGDLDNARELVEEVADAELFTYPGDRHLFTDNSLPSYDAKATALVLRRVLELLNS